MTDVVEERTPGPVYTGESPIADSDEISEDMVKKEGGETEEDEEDDGLQSSKNYYHQMMYNGFLVALAIFTVVYLLAAFIIDFDRALALFVITVLVVTYQLWALYAHYNAEKIAAVEESVIRFLERADNEWKIGGALAAFLIGIMVLVMAIKVRDGRNMVSLFGLLVFIGLTWMFSWKPTKVKLRPVLGGVFIQFIFGYCVIRTEWGLAAIEFLADVFVTLLGYTTAGSSFVYAWLTDGSLFGTQFLTETGTYNLGPPFFFNVLPTVIFFSSLMSVGYYLRVMPWLVRKLGTL